MREIIFKAKRTDNGEWVGGSYHHCTEWYGRKVDKHYISLINSTYEYGEQYDYEVDPATIGQYASLTDKNDTKIFEGDIIRWKHWDEKYRERPVQYDPEWNRFSVWINGAGSLGVNKHLSEEIEVIGNVYDNS